MQCPHCDNGSGWIYDSTYGYVACAECNDNCEKPKPVIKTIVHRPFDGQHVFTGDLCWCQPVVVEPTDTRPSSEFEIAKRLN